MVKKVRKCLIGCMGTMIACRLWTKWSQLVPQKWRNRNNQRSTIQNKNSIKFDSHKKERDQLIHYIKQNYYAVVVDSLMSQKEKFRKHCRYDLLLHKYTNYGNRKYSFIYEQILQVKETNKSHTIFIH